VNRSQLTPDGTRPATVPSYIDARERADRRHHLRARLLLLVVALHLVYFIVPLLPFAQTRALLPLLLWLPPLFAVTFLFFGIFALRRWSQRRRQTAQFIPLPPVEEVS